MTLPEIFHALPKIIAFLNEIWPFGHHALVFQPLCIGALDAL